MPRLPTSLGLIRALVIGAILLSGTVSTYLLTAEKASADVIKRFRRTAGPPAKQRAEWAPRVGSIELAQLVVPAPDGPKKKVDYRTRIALFFAAAFFVTGLLYVATDARAAPFMSLGTFATLWYCNTKRTEPYVWNAWDMPALVLSAATLCLAMRRAILPLAALVVVGVAFKETLLVMALFFLFYEGRSRRFRWGWTAGTIAAGVLMRKGIELWVGPGTSAGHFMHIYGRPEEGYRFVANFHHVFSWGNVNQVLWTNAGLWALVFALPSRDPVLRGFRWIALAMYAGLFIAGSFREFRVFLEALPGTLLLAHGVLEARDDAPKPAPV